jgi:chromatin remodeling complex protein RSC6
VLHYKTIYAQQTFFTNQLKSNIMAKAAKKAAATTATKAPKKAAAAAPKKAAAKNSKAGAKGVAKAGDNGKGRTANPAFMKPLTVDGDLAKIVGKEPLPRTEIVKKMWEYIRAHDLQDKNNKRMINADANLKVIFDGKDQVSMFELAKVVNNHVKK